MAAGRWEKNVGKSRKEEIYKEEGRNSTSIRHGQNYGLHFTTPANISTDSWR
jgi:hypothetical protein